MSYKHADAYKANPNYAKKNELDILTHVLVKEEHEVGFTPSITVKGPAFFDDIHKTNDGLVLVRQNFEKINDLKKSTKMDHHKARFLYKKLLGEGYLAVEPRTYFHQIID
tara:strand:+ start:532 stop:861 length:330 start_codon:yes stop_codon:yes gene_type:complete